MEVFVVMPLSEMVRRYNARPRRLPLASVHLARFGLCDDDERYQVDGKRGEYRVVEVLCGARSEAWFVLSSTGVGECDCLECGALLVDGGSNG